MMILGGALISPLQGLVADLFATPTDINAGLQISLLVPFVCYLYLTYYGFVGFKRGKVE